MTTPFIQRIIPVGMSKDQFVDEILFSMSNMHSHVDIIPTDQGVDLIRSYEISDDLLDDYGVPAEQHLGSAPSLEAMQNFLIKSNGLATRRFMFKQGARKRPLAKLAEREKAIYRNIQAARMAAVIYGDEVPEKRSMDEWLKQTGPGSFRVVDAPQKYNSLKKLVHSVGAAAKALSRNFQPGS